ncbi:MAG TPA: hypothetical protein VLG09_03955 [Candidatus Saccharimonadales bacterium]|nr:hypothetical protein [Candidatus Saccharimonadales bacterium]
MTRYDRFDIALRARIERVARVAERFGERGIVEWSRRAVNDAVALGRARDRDIATLTRLEGTFADEYYSGGQTSSTVYA